MILITCPHCGSRNSSEFSYLGEAAARPDPGTVEPDEWRRYLYESSNPAGWIAERWHHRAGCRCFLTLERNTLTNEIRAVRDAQEGHRS